ncbi:MAG: hypothetical protein ACRYGR_06275 [Janthinobacterium lividum]
MTKTIVRKNVLSLTLSILIGLATNLCLASNDQEELFPDIKFYEKQQQRIDQLNLIQPKFVKGTFSSKEARNVLLSYVGYTNYEHPYPIIGSCDADSGIIIGIYNFETKSAALCHLDLFTEITALQFMFTTLRSHEDSSLEIHFAGGNYVDERLIKVINFIENQPNIVVKSSKLFSSDKMAIDARTGNVFDIFDFSQLSLGKNYSQRLEILDLELQNSAFDNLEKKSSFGRFRRLYLSDFLKIEPDLEPNPKSD